MTVVSSQFLPENLREEELYLKLSEILDKVILDSDEIFTDILNKYRDSKELSLDSALAITSEYGFDYIANISNSLVEGNLSIMLNYMGMIHLLKGHKSGLELVLQLLGFSFSIEEWWESSPKFDANTFDMTIFMNLSNVPNIFETIQLIKIFIGDYVIPQLRVLVTTFDIFPFVDENIIAAGFVDSTYGGTISGSVPA